MYVPCGHALWQSHFQTLWWLPSVLHIMRPFERYLSLKSETVHIKKMFSQNMTIIDIIVWAWYWYSILDVINWYCVADLHAGDGCSNLTVDPVAHLFDCGSVVGGLLWWLTCSVILCGAVSPALPHLYIWNIKSTKHCILNLQRTVTIHNHQTGMQTC